MDELAEEPSDGRRLRTAFGQVERMSIPEGDLDALRSHARSRKRRRLAAGSAGLLLLLGGLGVAVAAARPTDPPDRYRVGSDLTTTTAPPLVPTTRVDEDDPDQKQADYDNNVPQPVGTTEQEGFVLPYDLNDQAEALMKYFEARGYTNGTGSVDRKVSDAVLTLNAVDVRDADGRVVGKFSTRYIPLNRYPSELAQAQTVLDAFNAGR